MNESTTVATQDTIVLPGDIAIEYLTQGDPQGRPVLLLHGYTDSCRSYKPVCEALPSSVRCFTPSLRGHGNSSRPAEGYDTRDFSEDMAAFIRAMNVGPMSVIGHSMGTAVAMRLAIDHPHLVSGLILIGAFATFRGNAAFVEFYRDGISSLEDPIDEAFVREFQSGTLANPVEPNFLDSVIHESLKLTATVWKQCALGMFKDDFNSALDRVSAPTLLIWGDADPYCPRSDQDRLLRSIPESRLSIRVGAGHAPHWEEPQSLAKALLDFLDEHRAPGRGGRAGQEALSA